MKHTFYKTRNLDYLFSSQEYEWIPSVPTDFQIFSELLFERTQVDSCKDIMSHFLLYGFFSRIRTGGAWILATSMKLLSCDVVKCHHQQL